MNKSLYAQDGVDVEAGDSLSKYARLACERTYENSPFVRVRDASSGNFRGPRPYRFVRLPKHVEQMVAPDGIGTKTGLIDAAYEYFHSGHDLLAMAAMDITRWGGLPLVMSNVLDLSSVTSDKAVQALYDGLAQAAHEVNMVLINGETAELGPFVSSENPIAMLPFNWAGFAVGVIDPKRIINGQGLKAGQLVIALQEQGFRSNGISSVRKAFALKFGPEWWQHLDASESILKASFPSTLYDAALAAAHGWRGKKNQIGMTFIAHLTGGGIRDKFGRDVVMKQGFSTVLDNLYDPPPIMRACAEWRGMNNKDIYSTWNGGQGALVVLERNQDFGRFIKLMDFYGIKAQLCGEIVETRKGKRPYVEIKSRFDNKTFSFHQQ